MVHISLARCSMTVECVVSGISYNSTTIRVKELAWSKSFWFFRTHLIHKGVFIQKFENANENANPVAR